MSADRSLSAMWDRGTGHFVQTHMTHTLTCLSVSLKPSRMAPRTFSLSRGFSIFDAIIFACHPKVDYFLSHD